MLPTLGKYKNVLIAIALAAILYLGYTWFFPDGFAVSDVALVGENGAEVIAADQELLNLLTNIKQITLEGEVFQSPIFRSLEDFSRPLIPEPVGRPNPFQPL